ncbi:P-loop containing nucleoside triphosphate hydrolase protein [Mycena rebaudengoi]|nr:P-loop containing nucleoside triphosphate hydrolase protein [Mycena rebaudengoi]
MRRPSLETHADVAGDAYELRSSEDSETDFLIDPPAAGRPASRWLLFSLLSRHQRLTLLLPAVISSVFAGGIAPFMTLVIGHAFDAFSKFVAPPSPPDADPQALLVHRVGIAALELVGLALGSFALSSLTSCLWIWTGEHNVMTLRKRVYASVAHKDMIRERAQKTTGHSAPADSWPSSIAKPTKSARHPRSLPAAQSNTSPPASRASSSRSAAPGPSPSSSSPPCPSSSSSKPAPNPSLPPSSRPSAPRPPSPPPSSTAPSPPAGITAVKACTAASHEHARLAAVLARIERAVWRLVAVWGVTSGLAQFTLMGMFVQGFWFGAGLVRRGTLGAGDVMAVFWACLMAATSVQLANSRWSRCLRFVDASDDDDDARDAESHPGPRGDPPARRVLCVPRAPHPADPAHRHPAPARASRPTFIVGPSGSGKSTIAHLLAGLYTPQQGAIEVDGWGVEELRSVLDVAAVGQGAACVLFDMSVFENVALGKRGGGAATRAEVVAACRQVQMHDFIAGLPDGYDTLLGAGGASLSGGQKQRLALARVMLRDPDVLVLDEATSALDPGLRTAVFAAVRAWRADRTTIVITHDLAQVGAGDFVYVLKDGCVVESGERRELEGGGVFSGMVSTPSPAVVTEKKSPAQATKPAAKPELTSALTRVAPSALTRVARIAQAPFALDMAAFAWHRTPSPYKPLPAPSTVFTRPPSMRFTPSAVVDFDVGKEGAAYWNNNEYGGDIKLRIASDDTPSSGDSAPPSIWRLLRELYPTVPHKPLVFFGLVTCLLSGALTPVFSFLLSRLFFEVSVGAQDTRMINAYGALVLGAAALDGLLMGLKYFCMQAAAMAWVNRLRLTAYARVLRQDKRWFDAREAGKVGQVLVRDGDDARELLAGVVGQLVVVGAMFGVGMVWALVRGWELALVGFAIVPVFAAGMAAQAGVVARCEMRNKRAREEVAGSYYETISNIRGIRSMRFEGVFQAQFDRAADRALGAAQKGAFVEGCTYGVACGLIYLAEAVLFYFGAVLVARGTYTYLQMVQVLNLVVFTVTIGSQLMAFTQRIATSVQATRDFNELLRLPTRTDESDGFLRPALDGAITFRDVGFSYPGREDAPVLRNINMEIQPGECVALVGASGSGKSTIAALLQRLYEPAEGSIAIGGTALRATDVEHLRRQVSLVSQQPNLFDASVAENIAYGCVGGLARSEVRRAAEAANVHEFVVGLPRGYDTVVGENAALVSGGQAQRLQIARALARPSRVLVLDECTSALDDANAAVVLDTIGRAKVGRTTVMITHKVPVMRMCDRILVVHEGRIAEQGTYEELLRARGLFAELVGGEQELKDIVRRFYTARQTVRAILRNEIWGTCLQRHIPSDGHRRRRLQADAASVLMQETSGHRCRKRQKRPGESYRNLRPDQGPSKACAGILTDQIQS